MSTAERTDFYFDPGAPVQPDQFAVEFRALLDIYRSVNPRRVLEIGVREGGTLYQWMQLATAGAIFTAVDLPGALWGNQVEPDIEAWKRWQASFRHELNAILGDSHSPAVWNPVRAAAPYDFIFIDGDHTRIGVACDFLAYSPLARPGGLVVLHDILRDSSDDQIEVYQFWDMVRAADYRTQELTSYDYQTSRGLGVVYV